MGPEIERIYRKRVSAKGLVSFHVAVKETDLWICADRYLERDAGDLVFDCRHQLETYIDSRPEFATSLLPCRDDPYAPPLIREMIDVARRLGVGPMASVAGAVAQYVGRGLLRQTDQVIVENGGDIFLKTNRPATVSILAGSSPLSGKFGLLIPKTHMPSGVCSSSATVGHSMSMGIADVVCLVSSSATLSDGAATALGNRVKKESDLRKVADWASRMPGIVGGVVIVGPNMAAWGDIEMVGI
ncbi:MAG: UPF0280 family protein [Thermodesulfobacteriota bacterium]|nr:UPF0280 family protein [Thermodesulfobacteriota bacterium]